MSNNKKLKFSLDVKSNALLCPNPSEWYAKSYIQENVADNFRTVPGVKYSTKIASTVFDSVLQKAGCSWSSTDVDLDAEDVDVTPIDAMVQLCQYDLEKSFISTMMAKGDSNWTEANFLAHYWDVLSMKIQEELQVLRWTGNKTGAADIVTGYERLLNNATSTNHYYDATVTGLTADNIIGVLEGLISVLPEAVKANKANVRIYMSSSNVFKYQIATLGLNSTFNYTGELPLSFAGFKISEQSGMSDDNIVAANKETMVYAFDGEGDAGDLRIVNLSDTTAEPILRTRVGLKAGFAVLDNGAEAALFTTGVADPDA